MGENPSRFRGRDRPVEQVSWKDCQVFLDRISGSLGGGPLRLPTEAEWEYACRAGTTTPFWYGATITTDQANFGGNYPYAGGSVGEYRRETVGVRDLPCNGWGLYQMHGNVYEWCQDWQGDYRESPVDDPPGPDGGAGRVIRGGRWHSFARRVRSAFRSAFGPGSRDGIVGFRLARGQ